MSNLAFKMSNTLEKAFVFDKEKTSAFLLGSKSELGGMTFQPKLSDTDILVTVGCVNLESYVRHLREAFTLAQDFKRQDEPVDIFFLSKNILPLHLSLLAVLTGTETLGRVRPLYGKTVDSMLPTLGEDDLRLRKNIYKAEALVMSRECQLMLPVADTTQTRATAKQIIRTFKVIICSLSTEDELLEMEKKLFPIKDMSVLTAILEEKIGTRVPVDPILSDALNVEIISDWPTWMMAQEELAYWFFEFEPSLIIENVKERRLYEGIVRARNMLFPELRNIFLESDNSKRNELISNYADRVATVITRLGIAGVEELLDLTQSSTPFRVRQASDVLIGHLQEKHPGAECLAGSIILLEYALERSMDRGVHLNQ